MGFLYIRTRGFHKYLTKPRCLLSSLQSFEYACSLDRRSKRREPTSCIFYGNKWLFSAVSNANRKSISHCLSGLNAAYDFQNGIGQQTCTYLHYLLLALTANRHFKGNNIQKNKLVLSAEFFPQIISKDKWRNTNILSSKAISVWRKIGVDTFALLGFDSIVLF